MNTVQNVHDVHSSNGEKNEPVLKEPVRAEVKTPIPVRTIEPVNVSQTQEGEISERVVSKNLKEETFYTISGAARKLSVEAHVLRYWEDELELAIPRNKMGHRVYGVGEIELFRRIMQWKEDGLSLKEIQEKCRPFAKDTQNIKSQVIPYPSDGVKGSVSPANPVIVAASQRDELSTEADQEKMQKFKMILGRIVAEAMHDNSEELSIDIAGQVSTQVNKELDFLFREKEEADETRYRKFDEMIRGMQKARQEAAAAEIEESKTRKKHRLSRRKREKKKQ